MLSLALGDSTFHLPCPGNLCQVWWQPACNLSFSGHGGRRTTSSKKAWPTEWVQDMPGQRSETLPQTIKSKNEDRIDVMVELLPGMYKGTGVNP